MLSTSRAGLAQPGTLLAEEHEQALLTTPDPLSGGGRDARRCNRAPHPLAHYLRELANDFHTYYNAHQFLVDDAELRDARLTLILALRQVVRNGLGLLGVSAPEAM